MNTARRAAILKLAAAAYEMDLAVVNGLVRQDEQGQWHVDQQDLTRWLGEHVGEEVVIILGSLADKRPVPTRTCRTCGRDYTDLECPYCRASRIRLRGQP